MGKRIVDRVVRELDSYKVLDSQLFHSAHMINEVPNVASGKALQNKARPYQKLYTAGPSKDSKLTKKPKHPSNRDHSPPPTREHQSSREYASNKDYSSKDYSGKNSSSNKDYPSSRATCARTGTPRARSSTP